MTDFAWFDIALIAAIAIRYALMPYRGHGVFFDPTGGLLAGLIAPAVAGDIGAGAAVAAPAIAADVAAPAIAGTVGADLAGVAGADLAGAAGFGAADVGAASALGGSTLFSAAPLATLPEVSTVAAAPIGAGALPEIGAGAGAIGGAAGAGSSIIAPVASAAGDVASSIIPGTLGEIGAGAGAEPIAAGAAGTGFGASAPATSAAPLAASAGGGAPAVAADATQTAAAAPGVGTDATAAPAATTTQGVGTAGAGGTTGTGGTAAKAATGSIGSQIIDFAKKNPGLLLSAAPLLLSMFGKPSQVPGQAQLQNAQEQAASMGKTLSAFQLSGTLPAGLQDTVNAKNAADKAAIRSNFAQLGYTGSTAERQALNQADQATTGQIALIGQQLASQGLDWTHISQQELETLLNTQLKEQQDFSSALGNLAKGLVPIGSAVDKSLQAA